MTEKKNPNSRYFGHLTYEGKLRDAELGTLLFYLRGKPDNQGWRDIFAQNDAEPVEYNGRIFPDWAVEDVRVLFQEDPQTVINWLAQFKFSPEDIPPLQ